MKFSELSKREYIALDVAGHLAGATGFSPQEIAEQAYELADTLIAYEGKPKRDAEFEDMKERLATVDRICDVLRESVNSNEEFAALALAEIWEFLGVKHQTAAMQMLRDAFPELVK